MVAVAAMVHPGCGSAAHIGFVVSLGCFPSPLSIPITHPQKIYKHYFYRFPFATN